MSSMRNAYSLSRNVCLLNVVESWVTQSCKMLMINSIWSTKLSYIYLAIFDNQVFQNLILVCKTSFYLLKLPSCRRIFQTQTMFNWSGILRIFLNLNSLTLSWDADRLHWPGRKIKRISYSKEKVWRNWKKKKNSIRHWIVLVKFVVKA